jgi:hypothetical protein
MRFGKIASMRIPGTIRALINKRVVSTLVRIGRPRDLTEEVASVATCRDWGLHVRTIVVSHVVDGVEVDSTVSFRTRPSPEPLQASLVVSLPAQPLLSSFAHYLDVVSSALTVPTSP